MSKLWASSDCYETAKTFFPEHEIILDETLHAGTWMIGELPVIDNRVVEVKVTTRDNQISLDKV